MRKLSTKSFLFSEALLLAFMVGTQSPAQVNPQAQTPTTNATAKHACSGCRGGIAEAADKLR